LIVHRNDGVSLAHGGYDRMFGSAETFSERTQRDRGEEQFGLRRPFQESMRGAVINGRGTFLVAGR
jgi:hypothetical protein